MPSLIGNKPNQVPSNGDLGTLAFQDATAPKLGAVSADSVASSGAISGTNITASGSVLVGSNGTYAAGALYSDSNWGMIIRAKQASPSTADFSFQNSAGTERFRVSSSVLNLTGLQGIEFQATQSASSNANTLDDYEEGTWTPTVIASGGSGSVGTYNTRNAIYTKIGRLVSVSFYLGFTKGTLSGGTVNITGLPFTPAGGTYSGSALSYWNNLATGQVLVTGFVIDGTTEIEIHSATGAVTTLGGMPVTALNGSLTNEMILNITYPV
jgi:hypothetical protein